VLVLVDLWALWCGPCRMASSALEQLATEKAGQIKLVKVKVDESPALQRRLRVQSASERSTRARRASSETCAYGPSRDLAIAQERHARRARSLASQDNR
jgi:thiol-disulfide isomerase/thioredoxin